VQSYEVADNIDLVDLCGLLLAAGPGADIQAACRAVTDAVEAYVMKQGFKGRAVKNSHGVAIYFPTESVSPLYAGLDFVKKTGWGKFVQKYLGTIRSR
jgi:hypothetical protein